MNKREFLQALAALPPEYKPSYESGSGAMRYRLYTATAYAPQIFCPLTAVANVQRPVSPLDYGTLNVNYGAAQLKMDRSLAWAVAHAADESHWYDGLFRRRVRRIFRKQFEAAYPNLGKPYAG